MILIFMCSTVLAALEDRRIPLIRRSFRLGRLRTLTSTLIHHSTPSRDPLTGLCDSPLSPVQGIVQG